MSLTLSLSSPAGSQPAALGWTLSYPAGTPGSVSVTVGPAASAAGKSIACSGAPAAYACILSGINSNVIGNGIVAVVSLTAAAGTSIVGVSDVLGVTDAGQTLAFSGIGATVTAAPSTALTVTAVTCAPASLGPSASAACNVTLSAAASAGGTVVQLTSSSPQLSLPPSVTVASGSATASFPVTAGTAASDQTVTVTAALNASTAKTNVTLTAALTVSSVQCAALGLTPNTSTLCSLTLSKPAPAGGLLATLKASSPALDLPATVAIPANGSSASFTVAAGVFTASQTVGISAFLGSFSASTALSLHLPGGQPVSTLLFLQGSRSEVAGTVNNSAVQPTVAPPGLQGSLVVNGTGAPNFPSEGGVFFTNCCTNKNNAYYKFTGAALGSAFGVPQGQISFTLKSRFNFAERQAGSEAMRYAFDVRDANGHQFYFVTQVSSGYLLFSYMVAGSAQSYFVPKGSEDQLFGRGVPLLVALKWESGKATLLLNGAAVKTTPYVPPAADWNSASIFDLGAYEYRSSGGYSVCDEPISNFAVAGPGVFQLRGDPAEVTGSSNGSTVKPTSTPVSLTGRVVVNGTGSVNFTPGGGVYFLNCCSNKDHAYYKFTGAALGSIFNLPQGHISFTLKSRFNYALRPRGSEGMRYAFDVRDANGHQFYFVTQVASGGLLFSYMVAGAPQYYFVPAGTEDRLFGSGVSLNVALKWDGSNMSLQLNGATVKTTSYVPVASNWNAASNFDLGAYEYRDQGGYSVSDDSIKDFTVKPSDSPVLGGPVSLLETGSQPKSVIAAAPGAASSLACDSGFVAAGSAVICELEVDASAVLEPAEFALSGSSGGLRLPAAVTKRAGQSSVRFEIEAAPGASAGLDYIQARSGSTTVVGSLEIRPAGPPALRVPRRQVAAPGSPVRFDVLAEDRAADSLLVSGLPPGATFDASTGAFFWLPSADDLGSHRIRFTAGDALGLTTTREVEVEVLAAAAGSLPQILTVGDSDSEQAMAVDSVSSKLASIPTSRFDGQPVRPGDILLVSVAGMDCRRDSPMRSVSIRFGSGHAPIRSILPVEGAEGVCSIAVEVPYGGGRGKVPIRLEIFGRDGRVLASNTASIAVEHRTK